VISTRPFVRFPQNVSPRKKEILEIAAELFASKGYRGTSMRDIGNRAGLLGGSLYHHIKSKNVLFVELHNAALDAAAERIEEAVAGVDDPAAKLEAICIAFVEIQVDVNSLTFPLMSDFQQVPEDVRQELIARRDRFETYFRRLVEELPLPDQIDRSIYRNALLAQLNSVPNWYRPGRLSAADVGRQIALIFLPGRQAPGKN
jgi:AcrR family transcriptional regulator